MSGEVRFTNLPLVGLMETRMTRILQMSADFFRARQQWQRGVHGFCGGPQILKNPWQSV